MERTGHGTDRAWNGPGMERTGHGTDRAWNGPGMERTGHGTDRAWNGPGMERNGHRAVLGVKTHTRARATLNAWSPGVKPQASRLSTIVGGWIT